MRKTIPVAAALVTLTSLHAGAGDLAAPGTPEATMVTLDQIAQAIASVDTRRPILPSTTPGEPGATYRIGTPGSYILTTNLRGVSGEVGVLIEAPDVTIDLNGFELSGVPGSLTGILASFDVNETADITVRNGRVAEWGEEGINLEDGGNSLVEDVHVSDNGLAGLHLGANSVVRFCTADDNGAEGIIIGTGSVASECSAISNEGDGFWGEFNSAIFTNCISTINQGHGFNLGNFNSALGCNSQSNTLGGFAALGESNPNTELGSSIIDCSSDSDRGPGIEVNNASLVRGNRVTRAGLFGSTSPGILVTGDGNLIDGNLVTANTGFGIELNGIDNTVTRNSASANDSGNYFFALIAENVVGTVVTDSIGLNGGSAHVNISQ